MSPRPSEPHLVVGRIGRPVGLNGEVEVLVLSDAEGRFTAGNTVFRDATPLVLRSARRHGDRQIVAFEGIDDRNGADALKGAELTIPTSDARPLDEGEYWDHDLIGCVVVTTTGDEIGRVTDVLHQLANSVLVVTGTHEHLIPLVADIVRHVVPGQQITIDPLPGLLGD